MSFPLSMPIAGPLSHPITRYEGGGVWTPVQLFAAGGQGVWYDPSDLSTLWQDTAGTVPVTADGDSVARVDDKSGGGKHLIQASGPSIPKYKTDGTLRWLLFDGTDDSYGTSEAVDLSASDQMTACAGVLKASEAALGAIVEFSPTPGANNGAFNLFGPRAGTGGSYSYQSKGTVAVDAIWASVAAVAPNTSVLTGLSDISADYARLRVNGVQQAEVTTDQGTGNFGNYTLFVGRRNNTSLPFNGRMFSIVVINRVLSGAELAQLETYSGAKTGLVL